MKTVFSNKVYDVLKWVCIVFLPALAVLVGKLFPVWDIPYGDKISQTIVYVNAFLGACLCISSVQYSINKAQQDQDAYKKMISQNNALREELVVNLDNTFENFDQEEAK